MWTRSMSEETQDVADSNGITDTQIRKLRVMAPQCSVDAYAVWKVLSLLEKTGALDSNLPAVTEIE